MYALPFIKSLPTKNIFTYAISSSSGKDLLSESLSPSKDNVQEYTRRYAEKHNVLGRIRYGCEVKTIIREETSNVWTIHVTNQHEMEVLFADILIMAVGNNDSTNPYIPQLPNQDIYQGKVLHSSEVGDGMDLLHAEKVIIIGGSKSAYDIGQMYPNKTTLIMRTPHYWFPRWLLYFPFFDRFLCWLFRSYRVNHGDRSIVRLLDEVLMPLFALGINKPTKNRSVLDDIMNGGGIHVCTTLSQYNNAKKWKLKTSSPKCYTPDGLELENGEIVQADTIVWGTGFKPSAFFKKAYLWKYIMHTSLPNCYFIGFRDPSLSTLCNASLQSLWAVHCEAGLVKLPEVDEMKELLDDRMRQTRHNFPYSHRRGFYDYFLRPPRCDYSYGVDLVKDCGLENRLASFWCHPVDIWSFTSNFSAVLAMPIQRPNTSTTDIEFNNEKMPLALV